jgi:hypothetical protein
LSHFHAAGTLERLSLAELLERHVAAASNPSDPAGDRVTAAAADRLRQWAGGSSAAIEDWARPASLLSFEEFLAPGEISGLADYVLSREADFEAATLVGSDRPDVFVDLNFRAARSLGDLGPFQDTFEKRIDRYLPFVCARLGFPPIGRHWFEYQLTAIPDGGFFRRHDDNSHPANQSRRLTFVFYFYCSPFPPSGGELRFWPEGAWHGPVQFPPLANRIVFFDSSIPHEVLPVRGSSDRFEAARFTVNGWVHQDRR